MFYKNLLMSLLKPWLPTRSNFVFLVLIVGLTYWANTQALNGQTLITNSNSMTSQPIKLQGFLTDPTGIPIDTNVNLVFRLYDSETSGTQLWSETHSNVVVEDGLYAVRLGSLNPFPNNLFSDYIGNLWLGVQVNTDPEMTPREPIDAVPFALNGGSSESLPPGTVISWWRPNSNTPLPSEQWMVADGSVVTDPESPFYNAALPDLTNKFIMGVTTANIGSTGGTNNLNLNHSHPIPNHTHAVSGNTSEVHEAWDGGPYTIAGDAKRMAVNTYINTWYYRHNHNISLTTSGWSGNTGTANLPADNRPAYVGMIYLVKIK